MWTKLLASSLWVRCNRLTADQIFFIRQILKKECQGNGTVRLVLGTPVTSSVSSKSFIELRRE